MWSIQEVEGLYYLTIFGKRALDPVKKTEYGNISDIQRGRNAEELHIKFHQGTNGRRVLRSKFEDKGLNITNETNATFIRSFNELIGKVTQVPTRKRKEPLVQPEDCPDPKCQKGDREEVVEKFIGEYKIRLTNLEQPPPHLLIREIKRQWVSKLSKQLLNTALVSTILPVMEKQNETEEDKKYFVLGGNHLVQATRAIWPEREMTCHVYRQLTTEEALRISSKHNSKQKAIPLSFQDKVKLARRLIQTSANGFSSSDFKGILGEIEMKEIKDSISTVLSVARYSQRNFNMFSQIADDWETKFGLEKSINQKLFKQLQAETEDTRNITLKMAVTESVAKACTWLDIEKQKEAAKRVFIKETGSVSWQNAQDTYPAHAEKLMKFAESTKCRLTNEIVVDLSKKAVAEDGIGQEEDHVVINILRKGKDISENDKIKELIEKYQKKIKKEIETILLDMEE